MSSKVKKEESPIEEIGFRKASDVLEAFKNRRVDFIRPLSVALATARKDPYTKLPGIPRGAIVEVAGGAGRGKTSLWEHFVIQILKDSPLHQVAICQYEVLDNERFENLQSQGFDLERINLIDYTNEALETAEKGLNALLSVARMSIDAEEDEEKVVTCVVDSFGAMGVAREIYAVNKQGKITDDLKGVEETPQMAVRAQIITRFINQWITLDPNKRPTLIIVNHMKNQLKTQDASTDQLKVEKIGEDLNYTTLGGKGFPFHCDMRIKAEARKWPASGASDEKHPLFGNKVQEGLEIFYEIFRNRFFPGKKVAKGILNFSDRRNVYYDLEEEVISYASYLEVDGICEKGQGRVVFPKLGDKSYYKKECIQYLRDNQEYMWDLIREIAKDPEKLFKIKKKSTDKDSKDSTI